MRVVPLSLIAGLAVASIAQAQTPAAAPAPAADPVAAAVLNVVQNVCMPAAKGGDLAKLTKAAGFRKSGENFVLKQPTYQMTVLSPGSNPNQCHVDMVHPYDKDAPAKGIVLAVHEWAVTSNGWSLYRNDKNVDTGQEFTTRSWEHAKDGASEALVLTTIRKADGSASQKNGDTSMVIYSYNKTAG